jgi:ribulose-phosphate 3-epimerase
MIKISPSVMCISSLELKEQITSLNKANVDMYHIDVMDGSFVPNFALNKDLVKDLRQITSSTLDVHIMAYDPERYVEDFVQAGADIFSVHVEAVKHPIRVLKQIRQLGCKAGIAIDPATDIDGLEFMLDYLDMVVMMTVDPGFAGQQIIPAVYDKIKKVRSMIQERGLDIDIQVDGQVKETTAPKLVECGANVLVLGSSGLFKYKPEEYPEVIANYKSLKA